MLGGKKSTANVSATGSHSTHVQKDGEVEVERDKIKAR